MLIKQQQYCCCHEQVSKSIANADPFDSQVREQDRTKEKMGNITPNLNGNDPSQFTLRDQREFEPPYHQSEQIPPDLNGNELNGGEKCR